MPLGRAPRDQFYATAWDYWSRGSHGQLYRYLFNTELAMSAGEGVLGQPPGGGEGGLHNSLLGLQGGLEPDEYFHFGHASHDKLADWIGWAGGELDQGYATQIGVQGDADLMGLASGALTVNGTLSVGGAIDCDSKVTIEAAAPLLEFVETGVGNYRYGVDGDVLFFDYDEGSDGGGDYSPYTRILFDGGVDNLTLKPALSGELHLGTESLPVGNHYGLHLSIAADTDVTGIIGCGKFGYMNNAALVDYMGVSHVDMAAIGTYALLQSAAGKTLINAATGQVVTIRINNAGGLEMSAAGLYPAADSAMTSGASTKYWSNTFSDVLTLYPGSTIGGGASGISQDIPTGDSYFWDVNSALRMQLSTSELSVTGTINTTVSFEVDGTKVVGNQGDAVGNLAIDADWVDDGIPRFNILLARLRAATGHGLFA